MQNVVSLLASGESIKIDNTLVSNVNSLSFVLENNKRYEDSISVYNARELKMEGKVYSDNNRVIIKNREINDKIKKISFTIDTTDMEDGSKIEGNISVIVDVGSINIPFEYTISENENKKKIRELNNDNSKIIYVISLAILSTLSRFFIPDPYGTFINFILCPLLIMYCFKTNV